MTDGWNWRRPSGPAAPGAPDPASPWWSDAPADPWRDPYAPAAVHIGTAPTGEVPQPEVVPDPDAPRRGLGPILAICLVTALLAGGLGGTLGFVFAVRGGYATNGGTQIGATAQPVPESMQRAPETLAGVAERVLPSVVTVRVTGAIGSGFVVSEDGYVITNDHVVEGANDTMSVAFSDGSTASAEVVGRDPESDIAVIKVAKSGLAPVALGDSDAIAVGDPVLAFGSPLALVNTVTSGIVSALDRPIEAGEAGGATRYYAAIQTDAAVNQGNSGGPLVNAAGQVIGVNSVIRSVGGTDTEAGNIGLAFAIPINQAKRVAQDIIDTGKARRTVIGAEVVTGETAGGARLRSVEPAGPAASAGLKSGDVLTKIDGHVLEDGTDLIALVRKYAPGATVPVEYRRGTKSASASVTLAADTN
ncbi:putative trypsin-like serine protease [Actinoplanes missouriensis 431]|uniref:Putative trypsin-like serine protease n=1 Tax=Actinoplanes missouriensis (strain ATCC 14538 / DSM 43046 / CBS 188.64 / JCM 3121 / NBRC 102363 / NCIMB 12654 / NRRL B-3342 / UNCC 431) TaxID=512565 RepID=I0HIE3_ACTM4|nr:trypsin-like peptidase domain-containing protein [Actinoplanes missouriensis]BAL92780.1 putative trypsin-like serine protease [Actinoplanes missouriensis 431]